MLFCTSICIRTYVSKDSLLHLCVTGMDVSRGDHWGHDLIAQSLVLWLLQSFLPRDSFLAWGSGAIALRGRRPFSWPFLALGCGGQSEERNMMDIHTCRLTCPHSCGQCFSYLLPFIEAWAGPWDPPTSPTAHHRPTLSLWLPLCFLFPDPSQDTTTPSPVGFPLLSHFPWDSGLFLTPVAGQHLSERWQALTLIHPASACQGSETDSPSWSSSEWAHPHLVFNLKDHSKIWPVFQIQKTGSWPYGNICCIN